VARRLIEDLVGGVLVIGVGWLPDQGEDLERWGS